MRTVKRAGPWAAQLTTLLMTSLHRTISTLSRVSNPERRIHEGRPVINRGWLMRELNIGRSTAEQWYRERADNGHPPAVLTLGRQLFWDEENLLGWARARLANQPPTRIVRDGRTLVTRVAAAHLTGMSETALNALYARRIENGHPEAVHREGRWLYFDEEQIRAWHAHRQAEKTATLTEVDRAGDPVELIDATEAARILGYRSRNTILAYRSRNIGYFPEPDATAPLRWKRSTLWAFADRRSKPGRKGHPRG